jgi:hypothetical protein
LLLKLSVQFMTKIRLVFHLASKKALNVHLLRIGLHLCQTKMWCALDFVNHEENFFYFWNIERKSKTVTNSHLRYWKGRKLEKSFDIYLCTVICCFAHRIISVKCKNPCLVLNIIKIKEMTMFWKISEKVNFIPVLNRSMVLIQISIKSKLS